MLATAAVARIGSSFAYRGSIVCFESEGILQAGLGAYGAQINLCTTCRQHKLDCTEVRKYK